MLICFSCKNEPQLSKTEMLDNVIDQLSTKIDNPESFELVSFKVMDSKTWRESLNKTEKIQSDVARGLKKDIELAKVNGVGKTGKAADELNEMLANTEKSLESLNDHRNSLGNNLDDIYMYEYELTCMLQEESHEKILKNYDVFIANPSNELIYILNYNGKKTIVKGANDPFLERLYPNLVL